MPGREHEGSPPPSRSAATRMPLTCRSRVLVDEATFERSSIRHHPFLVWPGLPTTMVPWCRLGLPQRRHGCPPTLCAGCPRSSLKVEQCATLMESASMRGSAGLIRLPRPLWICQPACSNLPAPHFPPLLSWIIRWCRRHIGTVRSGFPKWSGWWCSICSSDPQIEQM